MENKGSQSDFTELWGIGGCSFYSPREETAETVVTMMQLESSVCWKWKNRCSFPSPFSPSLSVSLWVCLCVFHFFFPFLVCLEDPPRGRNGVLSGSSLGDRLTETNQSAAAGPSHADAPTTQWAARVWVFVANSTFKHLHTDCFFYLA